MSERTADFMASRRCVGEGAAEAVAIELTLALATDNFRSVRGAHQTVHIPRSSLARLCCLLAAAARSRMGGEA